MKLLYIFFLSIILFGCNKIDDGVASKSKDDGFLQNNPYDNTFQNAFYYQNKKYNLKGGRSYFSSNNNGVFTHAFLLHSEGFSFDQYGSLIEANGSYIVVYLVTNLATEIESGEYKYSDIEYVNKTYNEAYVVIDYNSSTDDSSVEAEILDGVFNITNNGNNLYTVSFNCVDENGNKIIGNYSGEIIF